jgi:hypothetical protein
MGIPVHDVNGVACRKVPFGFAQGRLSPGFAALRMTSGFGFLRPAPGCFILMLPRVSSGIHLGGIRSTNNKSHK